MDFKFEVFLKIYD